MQLPAALVDDLVARALREDLGPRGEDLTTAIAVQRPRRARARIVAKASGVIAGLPFALAAFRATDPDVVLTPQVADGDRVGRGDAVLRIDGDAGGVLRAERTALNFLQRASGIATLTRAFVDAVAGTRASILDTRKTTPTLRAAEKYAVRMGGGTNHRFGLFDQVLLKENHFACALPEPVESVVARATAAGPPGVPVVAEARELAEALAAVRGGAGVVMLDNFELGSRLRDAIAAVRAEAERCGRGVQIEVSGGITLDNVAAYAACGVDRISIGALTHSAKALDLSLLVDIGAAAPEVVR
ncbi:MAG: carboxylating nicotinate-nucleotide diphosphorylase [Planctomycetes bacterium]|nr:carboxylating nicotinate-nucleotide diphosphorylase [Planctomycetota bacterium]